jgi:YVTN family beta-propeller protein
MKFSLHLLLLTALSLAGCSDESVTIIEYQPPLTVQSLFAINYPDSVLLGWTPIQGTMTKLTDGSPTPENGSAVEILIHRSRSNNFLPSSTTLYAVLSPTATRFVDTNIVQGEYYYYRLVPVAELPNHSRRTGEPSNIAVGRPYDYSTITTISFSEHIQPIFNSGCAGNGCHVNTFHDKRLFTKINDHNKEPFSLRTWEEMFKGGPHGAVLIPYKASKSHLVFHVNTDTLIAPVSTPQMPLPGFNLPPAQVQTLIRWINEGAANDVGAIAFSTYPKGKVLATNQSEDLVSIIDISTNLVARYIQAGVPNVSAQPPEAPHNLTVDEANGVYYVNLVQGGKVLKFRLSDNVKIGEVSGFLSPTQIALSVTGDTGFVAQFSAGTTSIRLFNTRTMTLLEQISSPFLNKPHGIELTPDKRELWVTGNFSDNLMIVNMQDFSTSLLPLVPNDSLPPGTGNRLEAYQTVMTSNNKYVYVTCRKSNEVRVVDRDSMCVVKIIPVGQMPLIPAITPDNQFVYVPNRNSNDVSVIRTSDNTLSATIANVGPQPHGIAITNDGKYAYVSCENVSSPIPPHHPTVGSKTPGFISVIDLTTNTVIRRIEVGGFAAGIAIVQ